MAEGKLEIFREDIADIEEVGALDAGYVARMKWAADEIERLREATTPSGETKAAFMGEFSMIFPEIDESGDERMRRVNVPWTTIKEIMGAIRDRADTKEG